MKRKHIIENIIGAAALVLCAVLFFISGHHNEFFPVQVPSADSGESENIKKVSSGVITVGGDLVYDGTGKLDIFKDVTATDGNGNDAMAELSAMITSDGSLSKKVIRYSFSDVDGEIISAKRYLVMKKYDGPSITVPEELSLEASELPDIINVLKLSGDLYAEDGFGKDVTDNVTCIREKLSDGTYDITFSLVNSYGDGDSVSSSLIILGEVEDPSLELMTDSVNINKGDIFDPLSVVSEASDGTGENMDLLKIDSSVDTENPGEYRVIYEMYNSDRTSVVRKTIYVTVSGD